MEIGDIQIASKLFTSHAILRVVTEIPLKSLRHQIEGYCKFLREHAQHDCLLDILPWLCFARCEINAGENEHTLFLKRMEWENEVENLLWQDPNVNGNLTVELHALSSRALLLGVFGDFSGGYKECSNLKRFDGVDFSYFMKRFLMYASAVCNLALDQETKKVLGTKSWSHARKARTPMSNL